MGYQLHKVCNTKLPLRAILMHGWLANTKAFPLVPLDHSVNLIKGSLNCLKSANIPANKRKMKEKMWLNNVRHKFHKGCLSFGKLFFFLTFQRYTVLVYCMCKFQWALCSLNPRAFQNFILKFTKTNQKLVRFYTEIDQKS